MGKSRLEHVNIFLVDFDKKENSDWKFRNGLDSVFETNSEIVNYVSNEPRKNFFTSIRRLLKYIFCPLHFILFKKSLYKNSKNIIAWQQFYGIFLAFYFRLFRIKGISNIYILNFIYIPKTNILGKLYKKIIEFSLNCANVKYVFCNSTFEKQSYSNIFPESGNKFYFFKIVKDGNCKFDFKKGNYFISAGRSNRDYDFLINFFSKHSDLKLKIVCDTLKVEKLPKNVEILNNCFGVNYKKIIAESFGMIISLGEAQVSSGQLVLYDALMLQKPIIVTKNQGILDYINENCILIDKNDEELENAIEKLKDEKFYASHSIPIKNSEFASGKEIANIIR